MDWIRRALRELPVMIGAAVTALFGANDALDVIGGEGNLDKWGFFIAFLIFAVIVIWRVLHLQERLDGFDKVPALQISGPCSRITDVDTNQLPLWSVVVKNTQPGSVARNVRVRMDRPNPQIIMASPVDLHRMHDNDKPFTKAHDIRYGESVKFDCFACGQINPDMYYLYRSDGDESSQVGPEWMLSEEDNSIISQASHEPEGWRFQVIATPDPPAALASISLCLKRDSIESWPSLTTTLQSQ